MWRNPWHGKRVATFFGVMVGFAYVLILCNMWHICLVSWPKMLPGMDLQQRPPETIQYSCHAVYSMEQTDGFFKLCFVILLFSFTYTINLPIYFKVISMERPYDFPRTSEAALKDMVKTDKQGIKCVNNYSHSWHVFYNSYKRQPLPQQDAWWSINSLENSSFCGIAVTWIIETSFIVWQFSGALQNFMKK